MASRRTLSSDPEFLLEFMHDLPDESDSDDDFDGYLEPDDGPVVTVGRKTLRSQSEGGVAADAHAR